MVMGGKDEGGEGGESDKDQTEDEHKELLLAVSHSPCGPLGLRDETKRGRGREDGFSASAARPVLAALLAEPVSAGDQRSGASEEEFQLISRHRRIVLPINSISLFAEKYSHLPVYRRQIQTQRISEDVDVLEEFASKSTRMLDKTQARRRPWKTMGGQITIRLGNHTTAHVRTLDYFSHLWLIHMKAVAG
jgi:hypothetical protein